MIIEEIIIEIIDVLLVIINSDFFWFAGSFIGMQSIFLIGYIIGKFHGKNRR